MNDDEFEQRLRQQPMRPIPAEWRQQILHSAIGREPSVSVREWSFVLRELFWPSPRAWAGLSAAWAVILALNTVSGDSVISRAERASTPRPSPQLMMALELQWQLRAELMDFADVEASPKAEPVQPRSEVGGVTRNA